MKKPTILRTRFIPFETVDISSDELVKRTDDLLITRWKAIKPRPDFDSGISFTFLKEGFKISRFYDEAGKFLYWYCDIIDALYDEATDTYQLLDLLVDIKMFPEGALKVLDTEELAEAMEKGLITMDQAVKALKTLDRLLKMIYDGSFPPEPCIQEVKLCNNI